MTPMSDSSYKHY